MGASGSGGALALAKVRARTRMGRKALVGMLVAAATAAPAAYGAAPAPYGTNGAGYAGAEDRLFLMDVLRHTGRAELTSFVGGSAGNRAQDAAQWAIAPYTEADLQRQIDDGLKRYGEQGQKVKDAAQAFIDGIN